VTSAVAPRAPVGHNGAMTDQPAGCPGAAELIARLDAAVTLPDVGAITARVKTDLEDLLGRGALRLPEALVGPRADTYARRLLHQDPDGRYTAVVMTWGPGQATAVHDHGGLWCVEGVVSGEMVVTQYEVTCHGDGTATVVPGTAVHAGIGSAGRLIPPTDYHVLGNARRDAPSVTLHVYGGSLDDCRIFVPAADGRYREESRQLSYHG
jgi:predicted metal-dependent enzyme (double-stranded beta helix superfamily)